MWTFLSLLIFISACGGDNDRQEDISKVRGLGLISTPLVSTPSSSSHTNTVDLSLFVAVPIGQTISFEKYTDQNTSSAFLLDASDYSILSATQTSTAYNAFSIVNIHVTAKVPTADKIPQIGGRVRLGFKAIGPKNTEKIIGNFLVVPPSDPRLLSAKVPTVDIQTPSDGQVLKSGDTLNIVGTYTNPNEEDLIVGWFASAGDITNRRSINTYWDVPSKGKHTLVLTLRTKESLGFAMKTINVTVQ